MGAYGRTPWYWVGARTGARRTRWCRAGLAEWVRRLRDALGGQRERGADRAGAGGGRAAPLLDEPLSGVDRPGGAGSSGCRGACALRVKRCWMWTWTTRSDRRARGRERAPQPRAGRRGAAPGAHPRGASATYGRRAGAPRDGSGSAATVGGHHHHHDHDADRDPRRPGDRAPRAARGAADALPRGHAARVRRGDRPPARRRARVWDPAAAARATPAGSLSHAMLPGARDPRRSRARRCSAPRRACWSPPWTALVGGEVGGGWWCPAPRARGGIRALARQALPRSGGLPGDLLGSNADLLSPPATGGAGVLVVLLFAWRPLAGRCWSTTRAGAPISRRPRCSASRTVAAVEGLGNPAAGRAHPRACCCCAEPAPRACRTYRGRRQVRLHARVGDRRREPDGDARPVPERQDRHRHRQEPPGVVPRALPQARHVRAVGAGRGDRHRDRPRRVRRSGDRAEPPLRGPALRGRSS